MEPIQISPEEAFRLFVQGDLLVAQDMATRLAAADFCVLEEELLDPVGWPCRRGLPVLAIEGIPGRFFRPSAILPFLEGGRRDQQRGGDSLWNPRLRQPTGSAVPSQAPRGLRISPASPSAGLAYRG